MHRIEAYLLCPTDVYVLLLCFKLLCKLVDRQNHFTALALSKVRYSVLTNIACIPFI